MNYEKKLSVAPAARRPADRVAHSLRSFAPLMNGSRGERTWASPVAFSEADFSHRWRSARSRSDESFDAGRARSRRSPADRPRSASPSVNCRRPRFRDRARHGSRLSRASDRFDNRGRGLLHWQTSALSQTSYMIGHHHREGTASSHASGVAGWARLQGPGRHAPPRRRHQALDPASPMPRPEALSRGSARARAAESSQHREPLRPHRARWRAADGHGIRGRRDLEGLSSVRTVAARSSRADRARRCSPRSGMRTGWESSIAT